MVIRAGELMQHATQTKHRQTNTVKHQHVSLPLCTQNKKEGADDDTVDSHDFMQAKAELHISEVTDEYDTKQRQTQTNKHKGPRLLW